MVLRERIRGRVCLGEDDHDDEGEEKRRSGRACVEIRRTKTGCGGEGILIVRYYGPKVWREWYRSTVKSIQYTAGVEASEEKSN